MMTVHEKPGAATPWPSINHLLDSQERFDWYAEGKKSYLFAPKVLSKLSALLYLLKEERIPFEVQGSGSPCQPPFPVFVSVRAFCQVDLIGEDCVAAGAGCELPYLQSRLFTEGYETGIEEWGLHKGTLGSFLLNGHPSGIVLRRQPFSERLLQVEWVRPGGGIVKWGQALPGAGGPCLFQLIWGLKSLNAVLVKAVFKVYRTPPVRLFLNWSFESREALWSHFHLLKSFTATWERLDAVMPKDLSQKAFILAQISGTEEEMQAFRSVCPSFQTAELNDKAMLFKSFFLQQNYHFQLAGEAGQEERVTDFFDYKWYHGLTDQAWIIQSGNHSPVQLKAAVWKQRLWNCLKGE